MLTIIKNKDMEKWKDIPNYEGFYQASNQGNVRSLDRIVKQSKRTKGKQLKRGRVLRPAISRLGYVICALSRDNKLRSFPVHRLVAFCWLDNPNNWNEVNHKDGNKQNNNAENLEWSTRALNLRHAIDTGLMKYNYGDKHHHSKMTNEQVRALRISYDCSKPLKYYAKKYGMAISSISKIIKNETYKDV